MSRFRTHVAVVVRERAQIRTGLPPLEAELWRVLAMELFCCRGARAIRRLVDLRMLPNGDWRCRSEVQLFAPAHVREKFGEHALVEMLVHGILYATCNATPPVDARHRWTGMDLSIDALGRLAILHDIMP